MNKKAKIFVLIIIIFSMIIVNNNIYVVEANDELPNRYNLAEHYDIKVENQGSEGNCWTFASLKTLETYLQIHGYGTYDFSENHLNYIESNLFSESSAERGINTSGTYEEFIDYMTKKFGPVLEEDFPYYEEGTNIIKKYSESEYDDLLNVTPLAFVDEFATFPNINKEYEVYSEEELREFRNSVKKHIMDNGAVYTEIIAPSYYIDTYYNNETYAAYFPNSWDLTFGDYQHTVAIIGWDDEFSKENFLEVCRPEHDGAYIALNSWGESFGDNGLYYISYDDVYVEKSLYGVNSAVTNISELKNTTSFTINSTSLYNAIKQKLGRKVNIYDDNAQSITIQTSELSKVVDLDLSGLNITDLSGIENFTNIYSINLSNNSLETIDPLSNLPNLGSLDLSCNKLTEIPDLLDGMELGKLSLNYNPIENFENLKKIKAANTLELEGTNFDNDDLEVLSDMIIRNLNLSKTKTTDYTCIETKELESLNISYNKNIIYESIPSAMRLYISHTETNDEQFKKIKNISFTNTFDISYTNIKDLNILPDMIGYIDISGNKELLNFDNLKYANTIYYQDAELDNVSIFKGFMASSLYLANNNITDYKDLLENEYLYYLDLTNNKLSQIEDNYDITIKADSNYIKPSFLFYGDVESLKNQKYVETIKDDNNKDDLLVDIANELNILKYHGYNLIITNALMDYENVVFQIENPDEDVIIKITNGKLEGSTITYKIEKTNSSNSNAKTNEEEKIAETDYYNQPEKTEDTKKTNSPKTGDNILVYIILQCISTLGLLSTVIYVKKS